MTIRGQIILRNEGMMRINRKTPQDPLYVPIIRPFTKARAKRIKEAFNELYQTCSNEDQALFNVIQTRDDDA